MKSKICLLGACFQCVHLSFRPSFFCGHSYLVIYQLISSKFHIWISLIKLLAKFDYEFCPMNDKQDGHKNGLHLMVCVCGLSFLVIYHRISSKLQIWITFIKFLPKFCLMTDNQDGHQNASRLTVCISIHSHLGIQCLSSLSQSQSDTPWLHG